MSETQPKSEETSNSAGFKDTEAKLDSVDTILTKVTKILKKHWLILIILLIGYGGYEFVGLVQEEINKINKPKVEEVAPQETVTEHFVVREYDEEQSDGTWLRILVWSDSVETVDENYQY